MKRSICSTGIIFFLMSTYIWGQNVVPNPSFETYSACPTVFDQIARATGWNTPTSGTSDYFNACDAGSCASSTNWVSVPGNYFGSEAARTGSGYAGLISFYDPSAVPEYREYIQAQLVSPLIAGTTYDVAFYVSCADGTCGSGGGISINKLGAYISAAPPTGGFIVLPFTPQILSPGLINSTTGWTLISGTFLAAGGEEYITIGNFSNDASTTIGNGPLTFTKYVAYYYIDDVCVAPQGGSGCLGALPAKPFLFTGNCTEQNSIRLQWSTATEINNDYFTVERSIDGNTFETIGIVEGAGNSSTTHNYQFTDDHLSNILHPTSITVSVKPTLTGSSNTSLLLQ